MSKNKYFEVSADEDPDATLFTEWDQERKRQRREDDRIVVQPKVARKKRWLPAGAPTQKVQGQLNFKRVNHGAIKDRIDKWHFNVKRAEALERKASMLTAAQLRRAEQSKLQAKIRLSKRRAEQRLRASRSKAAAILRLQQSRKRHAKALEIRAALEALLNDSRE